MPGGYGTVKRAFASDKTQILRTPVNSASFTNSRSEPLLISPPFRPTGGLGHGGRWQIVGPGPARTCGPVHRSSRHADTRHRCRIQQRLGSGQQPCNSPCRLHQVTLGHLTVWGELPRPEPPLPIGNWPIRERCPLVPQHVACFQQTNATRLSCLGQQ